MTLGEHLGELRRRVIICVIAFVIAATDRRLRLRADPELPAAPALQRGRDRRCTTRPRTRSSLLIASNGSCNLFVTSPLDGLTLRVKIALFGGLVLASPIILFQIWRFVTPGLKATERRYAIPFVAERLRALPPRGGDGLRHPAPRAGLVEVGGWPEPAGDLRPHPVPGPDPLDDDDLRLDLRVPRRPRLARAGARRHAGPPAQAPGAGPSSSSWSSPPSSRRARTPSPCSRSPSRSSSSTSSPSASGSCSGVDRVPVARPGDGRGGGVRGRPALRPRRLPARGLRRPGRRTLGAGVRPHRVGQDAGGGLRRAPGPGRARQGLLHHAAQGTLEPEVRGAGRLLRGGARRAADR